MFNFIERLYQESIEYLNNKLLIKEEQGINSSLKQITDELYNIVTNNKIELIHIDRINSINLYVLVINNYKLRTDCFINNIDIVVNLYVSNKFNNQSANGTYFEHKGDIENDKLNDASIVYKLYNNKFEIDKNSFYEISYHELTHAFTMYVMLTNNTYNSESAINNRNKMTNVMSNELNYLDNFDVIDIARKSVYFSDKFEIDAYASSTYSFIENHKEITSLNYKKYLNQMKLYNLIREIKALILFYDKSLSLKNEDAINRVNEILYNVYSEKYGKNECFKRMRDNLVKQYSYSLHKFYKILHYALEKNNRIIHKFINKEIKPSNNENIEYNL